MRYELKAFNTATASENKMHDDAVAATFGFTGGLVPGVDVYAYLCHLPAERWGRDWLERGTMSGGFVKPVYDGDLVEIETVEDEKASLRLTLSARGEVCAAGHATLLDAPLAPRSLIPTAPRPDPAHRPPATPAVIEALDVLGTTEVGFNADRAHEYLDDISEQAAVFREGRVAHPGWLLRQANFVLSETVKLGPWIHASSTCAHLGAVEHGERVTTRARVVDTFERKGHRFVELDVQWVAEPGDRLVMHGKHVAIYQPRGSA